MKKAGLLATLFMFVSVASMAQCAMCRATLENNLSNGNVGIAAGINFGIMYLFMMPYIAIVVIAFFWYRTSKRNAQNSGSSSAAM